MALLDRLLQVGAHILNSAGVIIDPPIKGQLPAALAAGGGLKVEGISGGVAQPVRIQAGTNDLFAASPADAANGGTSLYVYSWQALFNGAQVDRARSIASSGDGLGVARVGTLGEVVTLLASAVRTAGSGTSTPVTGLGWRRRYAIQLDVTAAATAADDTLDVYVDVRVDGTNYVNVARYTQVLGNGGAKRFLAVLDSANPGTSVFDVSGDVAESAVRPSSFGDALRVRWAIVDPTGADASFTFSVIMYAI